MLKYVQKHLNQLQAQRNEEQQKNSQVVQQIRLTEKELQEKKKQQIVIKVFRDVRSDKIQEETKEKARQEYEKKIEAQMKQKQDADVLFLLCVVI